MHAYITLKHKRLLVLPLSSSPPTLLLIMTVLFFDALRQQTADFTHPATTDKVSLSLLSSGWTISETPTEPKHSPEQRQKQD
ncbi:hypothetical protein QBC35DRAFT_492713 [Podospora australis]|uniref:Uncharacterized protein n=1 Tax=Podospora australis TaxID=1536484 RepID=A0AAN6WXU7_9PEZI|nr:hypothetical protein QBC35DRAFT_492713 [Podospora australis]